MNKEISIIDQGTFCGIGDIWTDHGWEKIGQENDWGLAFLSYLWKIFVEILVENKGNLKINVS